MNNIDPVMTQLLIGLYTGLIVLLMFNIFIAMLSSAFDKVESSAQSYFLMQRSSKIINLEHSSEKRRLKHLLSLRHKKINGDDDRAYRKNNDDDEFNEDVFCSLNELRLEMTDMEEKLSKLQSKHDDKSPKQIQSSRSEVYDGNDKEKWNQLLADIKEMKDLILSQKV